MVRTYALPSRSADHAWGSTSSLCCVSIRSLTALTNGEPRNCTKPTTLGWSSV